jgi:hypothetical protein
MIRYLKNRLRAYIDRAVRDCVTACANTIAPQEIDADAIAKQAACLVRDDLEWEAVAAEIDISELALQFDTADIAGEVDHYRLASHICMSTLAENFDVEEIASHVELDYKCLAAAILKELRPVEVRPSA